MKKILITGIFGQVGYELQRALAPCGTIIHAGRQEMDLANPTSIRKFLREVSPDIIVNPAAYTAVDQAEEEMDLCMAINAHAPSVIAEEAKQKNTLLIHYSTDYVFDGNSRDAYSEGDLPNPLNVYGASKLAGEKAIQEIGCPHLILRTSWVYGTRGKNFLLTMLKLGREKEHLNIVSDQTGAPTWSRLIAEATAQILTKNQQQKIPSGIYHLTSGGKTSWLDFAEAIFSLYSQKNLLFKRPTLSAILAKDYKTKALRPMNSLLSHKKLNETCAIFMPDWKAALKLCMDDLSTHSSL